MTLNNFKIIDTLSRKEGKTVYSARENGKSFILKEYPDPFTARRERMMCDLIDSPHVPGYSKEFEHQGKMILVQEKIEGTNGSDYLETLSGFSQKKAFARAIATALKTIHDKEIIYNGQSLEEIWVSSSGSILFFNVAGALLKHDDTDTGMPMFTEAQLPYVAPEKTGKVNHPVCLQTDLYALGVLFYRIFCDRFPFSADKPSELISLHVAKTPVPPAFENPLLPRGLSDIIMKLLEKEVSGRYITIDGLIHDLAHFEENDFKVGLKDLSPVLQISQKVYGREKEIKRLAENVTGIASGRSSFTIIAGYSGVGKSTLATEAFEQIKDQNAQFISGKFQQYKRSIPYFAFVEAFHAFVDTLLGSDDESIRRFKKAFNAAIGDQGKVLTSVFTDLELLVGKQKEIEKLMGAEAENRFKYVFLKFIDIVALPERPLVLFLDDLQWTDIVSLNILKALVQSRKPHLMVLLAYRDNEVDIHHPFYQFMEEMRSAALPMDDIKVEDLELSDIRQLVRDSLGTDNDVLSRIIHEKTHGNCFFVHQFLKNLIDRELVTLDRQTGVWRVDEEQVSSLNISENVVDLMQDRIRRLPPPSLEMLKLIGTIGHNVELSTLSIISGKPEDDLASLLQAPLEDGMVIRRGDLIFFVHDKIQQACYQLNDEKRLPSLHFDIANILIRHEVYEKLEDLFTVTAHLTKGFSCITRDVDTYIGIYLQAGRRSREVSAYDEYLQFIRHAMKLLPASTSGDHEFSCYSEYHIALHLNGFYKEADAFFEKSIQTGQDIFSLKDNYITKVSQDSLLGRYREATAFGLSILEQFDIRISIEPDMETLREDLTWIRSAFKQKGFGPISDLLKIPKRNHQEMDFLCELISAIVPPSFFYNPIVSGLLIFATIKLALKNGVFEAMGYPFSTSTVPFVMIENNYKTGYEYAEFAIRISGNNKRSLGNSKHLFILFAYHWLKPLKDNWSLETAREAFHLLQQSGDIQMAGFIYFNTIPYTLERGDPLTVVEEEITKGLDFAEKTQNSHSLGTFLLYRQLVLTLRSEDGDVTAFTQDGFDEKAHLAAFETNVMSHCYFHILKSMMLYIFNRFEAALPMAEKAMALLPYITGFIPVSTAHYYTALIYCRALKTDPDRAEELDKLIQQWETWAGYCRENWRHKLYLIKAEKYRALDRVKDAVKYYGLAIQESRRNEFTQDIALSYERFADFWYEYGNPELGEHHIFNAYETYSRWGCTRKLRSLEKAFPDALLTRKSRDYDLLNIIRAQNILTRETGTESLIRKLLKILLEVSAAEKVFLIRKGVEWQIEGFRDVHGNERVLDPLPVTDEYLSSHMVNYTIRTGRETRLDKFSRYQSDDYVRRVGSKSILVLPITSQSRLVAVIYLEHTGIEDLFSQDKLEPVRLLSSQIAISLINAQVYNDLEDLVKERTRELEKQNKALVTAQAMAEEAARVKSSFLANMSHEIRTPLNAILGYAQILLDRHAAGSEDRDSIKVIHQSGRHLLTLINDILDFSKIEADKIELFPETLDLPSFLEGIISMMDIRAKQKKIDFRDYISDDLPRLILADEKRLRQILVNLISNAVKFTHSGHILFRVSPLSSPSDRGKQGAHPPAEKKTAGIRFTITDTGIGISKEAVDVIFHPFRQVHDPGGSEEGTGLGLSISRELVELMGGEIQVKSRPGAGSTFSFDLTFPVIPRDITPVPEMEKKIIGFIGDPVKILVVDDNVENRRLFRRLLMPLGFDVLTADNGEEGVAAAKGEHPDVILMDIIMPEKNGIDAVREIRTVPGLDQILIIAVSASAFEDDRQKSLDAGCDAFLPKPVDHGTLLTLLKNHLGVEWTYESRKTAPGTAPAVAGHLVIPSRKTLDEIHAMALLGKNTQIARQAAKLRVSDPKYKDFADQISEMARRFDDKEMVVFLEQFMEGNA